MNLTNIMMGTKPIFIIICLCFLISSNNTDAADKHEHVLDRGWEFSKSEVDVALNNLEQLDWEEVTVPHSPKIEPKIVNNQWRGFAFYKRIINKENYWQNKAVFIRFEAAMNTSDIWLNGVHLYRNYGGYLPFTIDITQHLKDGQDNILLVKLNNQDNPVIGPKPLYQLDFNTYGGIYRDVKILVKPKLHITDEMFANKVAGGGIAVNFPLVNESEARISVSTHIENRTTDTAEFSLQHSLYFEGELIATRKMDRSLRTGNNQHFEMEISITKPALWHPKAPNLYKLVSQIVVKGEVIDTRESKIGIREFAFDENNQLLINGEVAFLRGVNRHQEYPYIGYAISDAAQYRDAVKIKSAGFDYVRVAHYPMSSAFMDAADELGIVVVNAILGWQYYSYSQQFTDYITNSCRKMIRRDRNRPSVLSWECSLNESYMPEDLVKQFHQIVKEEIPTGYSAGWVKGYDIYIQARQHRMQHYEKPKQPYIVSEYGDWEYYAQNAGLEQDKWADLNPEDRNSRQLLSDGETRLLQQALNVQEAHNDNFNTPAFADGYWVMFDYNRGYAEDIEASGVMSLYRLPKYSYYFFQSQRPHTETSEHYAAGPMVHIASNWDEQSPLVIKIFSNATRVDLYLNGNLVASKKPYINKISGNINSPPFIFPIEKFVPGVLEAKAYIENELVAIHSVVTPKAPTKVALSVDESGIPLQFGKHDTAFIYAQLLDHDGNKVNSSKIEVTFEVRGNAKLIGPEKVMTEKGIASALIKIGDSPENTFIKASVAGNNIEAMTIKLSDVPHQVYPIIGGKPQLPLTYIRKQLEVKL